MARTIAKDVERPTLSPEVSSLLAHQYAIKNTTALHRWRLAVFAAVITLAADVAVARWLADPKDVWLIVATTCITWTVVGLITLGEYIYHRVRAKAVTLAERLGYASKRIGELERELADSETTLKESHAKLRIGELQLVDGPMNGKSLDWHLTIHNDGAPVEDFHFDLVGITPTPSHWKSPTLFPYQVEPFPGGEGPIRTIGRNGAERFLLFGFFRGQGHENPVLAPLYAHGFDTHPHLYTKNFLVTAGERWRINYRIRCSNAESITFAFIAAADGERITLTSLEK